MPPTLPEVFVADFGVGLPANSGII